MGWPAWLRVTVLTLLSLGKLRVRCLHVNRSEDIARSWSVDGGGEAHRLQVQRSRPNLLLKVAGCFDHV